MATVKQFLEKWRKGQYLGDGVYASYDGYQIWLKTTRDGIEHSIALEDEVFIALIQMQQAIKAEALEVTPDLTVVRDE